MTCFKRFSYLHSPQIRKSITSMFISSVILLPLRPASLAHKNLQRRKIIHGMCPVGRRDRSSISTCVFVEISGCSRIFCGSYYDCCLKMHISFRLCCALNRRTIFLLNREFWSLSSHKLSGDRNAQAFSISDSFLFF